MTIKEFLQWVIEHKEYAPLYSSLVATGALFFSVLSFIISNVVSKNRAKKDKIISEVRYEEQKKQYDERLNEERKRREEDKRDTDEKNRISEEPYLVYKKSKVISEATDDQRIIKMEFVNKGRGAAYCIIPDLEFVAKRVDMTEFTIRRYKPVQDPIAMVGETFIMTLCYNKDDNDFFRMTPTIKYQDASGRNYKQTFCIDIYDSIGNGTIINYAQPELCEEYLRPDCD